MFLVKSSFLAGERMIKAVDVMMEPSRTRELSNKAEEFLATRPWGVGQENIQVFEVYQNTERVTNRNLLSGNSTWQFKTPTFLGDNRG